MSKNNTQPLTEKLNLRIRCEGVKFIHGEDGKHFRYEFRFVGETGSFTGSWDGMSLDRDKPDVFEVSREYDLHLKPTRIPGSKPGETEKK